MNGNDSHFDEMTALLYLENQLDAERTHDTVQHLAECAACRSLLRALERESDWLRESMAVDDEPIPARLANIPQHNTVQWIWIAAFGLMAGGIYTLWNGIVEPWYAQAQAAGFTQGNLLTMLFFSGAFWKGWDAMRSLMEFMAAATLGTVAVWLLRKRWRQVTAMAFVMSGIVAMLAVPSVASAAEVQHGNPSYTLAAGQVVNTDLIVAADRTEIDGTVNGDLIVFSNSVTVNGHVTGDVLAFAQMVRLDGPVDGNVRVMCQTLSLDSTVGKNVSAWAETAELDRKSTIGGSMILGSGNGHLDGRIAGDLLALSGDVDINGSLGRNATIRAQGLNIGSGAQITGRTKFVGRRQPQVAAGAKLGSPIEVTIERRGPDYAQAGYYWRQTMAWGASFLFGLVVLLVAPVFFGDVVHASDKVAPAIGLGVLFLFAVPIAAIFACITIVGLGLGVPAILLYLVALYSTQVFIGSWIGEKLLGVGTGIGPAIGRLALGLAILRGLRILPYIGWLVTLVMLFWGLGALALALHRMTRTKAPAAEVLVAH
jgi:cytoskeletal protein CcmA (bactofilin family)